MILFFELKGKEMVRCGKKPTERPVCKHQSCYDKCERWADRCSPVHLPVQINLPFKVIRRGPFSQSSMTLIYTTSDHFVNIVPSCTIDKTFTNPNISIQPGRNDASYERKDVPYWHCQQLLELGMGLGSSPRVCQAKLLTPW